jgi:predicted metal-dependent enzyme (double-stranded beta helix superfamily)
MDNIDVAQRNGLGPARLAELTRTFADEVRAGHHPPVGFDAERRWHRRIHRDETVDVWLIGWLPTQSTRLHDHGGSSGAFTVVSGELSEVTFVGSGQRAGAVRERAHIADASVSFGASYVHDVRNVSGAPAVSVHAYSPPLRMMKFYDVRDGRLAVVGALETDDPEPAVPRSLVR